SINPEISYEGVGVTQWHFLEHPKRAVWDSDPVSCLATPCGKYPLSPEHHPQAELQWLSVAFHEDKIDTKCFPEKPQGSRISFLHLCVVIEIARKTCRALRLFNMIPLHTRTPLLQKRSIYFIIENSPLGDTTSWWTRSRRIRSRGTRQASLSPVRKIATENDIYGSLLRCVDSNPYHTSQGIKALFSSASVDSLPKYHYSNCSSEFPRSNVSIACKCRSSWKTLDGLPEDVACSLELSHAHSTGSVAVTASGTGAWGGVL
ncbi:hypothetical protein AVEN_146330-1, partial [Araneus ventricosus]